MKKLASILAVGLALTSAAAMATDGTITINGKLDNNTCTVTGTTGSDVLVTLPTLSVNKFVQAGDVGGAQQFSIKLSNCTVGINGATVHFDTLIPQADSVTGNLVNTASAGNIQVQLLNDQSNPINVITQVNSQTVAVTNNAATLQYVAQYYATGQATPGNVKASVKYSMVYN
ncbi:fimbrial protein [Vogesella sp. LIG4]|uniref:fimbrial protein n=1 Tax=Vogesella sp. LIG4 TaxID=1192162 RepID=UPI00081FBA6F|nr:fimbrial protein [Vogesella sp. LIG4]SCK16983.1 major type 1 subunit fimbrin (pilin) [Vogesella sp. LIG4]